MYRSLQAQVSFRGLSSFENSQFANADGQTISTKVPETKNTRALGQ